MSAASGRFSYWLDANGDGLYDVVTATEPRADNTFAPGYLYLQSKEKPRTFLKQDWAEYGMDMVLTDVDGDGKIAELVISRHYECATRPDVPADLASSRPAPPHTHLHPTPPPTGAPFISDCARRGEPGACPTAEKRTSPTLAPRRPRRTRTSPARTPPSSRRTATHTHRRPWWCTTWAATRG